LERLERVQLSARDLVLLELALCLEKCPHISGESQSDLKGQFNRIGRHLDQILLVCSKWCVPKLIADDSALLADRQPARNCGARAESPQSGQVCPSLERKPAGDESRRAEVIE
jgi:hypothetical protein